MGLAVEPGTLATLTRPTWDRDRRDAHGASLLFAMFMRSKKVLAATAAGLVFGACADAPTAIRVPTLRMPTIDQHIVPISSTQLEFLVLCKVGPVGTYAFTANATHPVLYNSVSGNYDLTSATYTIDVTAGSTIDVGGVIELGECAEFTKNGALHNHVGLSSGSLDATVTIQETNLPADTQFDHVVTYQNDGGVVSANSSTTNQATPRLGGYGSPRVLTGASVVFYNTETVEPPTGCTLTQGYWKTHSEKGPAPYDNTWAQLPNGASTTFYLSGATWYAVFQTAPKGNAYYNLAHQFMAARLNGLAGANQSAVTQQLASAATLFAAYTPAQIGALKGDDPLRAQFIALASSLNQYNNGLLYPAHCN
jgi:hypothetical protein